jgi:hypothetical protein
VKGEMSDSTTRQHRDYRGALDMADLEVGYSKRGRETGGTNV